jgi:competence protein ComEC
VKHPELVILDVGHGNAAVLIDTGGVIVFDTGRGGVLLDFLRHVKIKAVDLMLVSHADEDHIGNAPTLLLDKKIQVRKLYFNSDAAKSSRAWVAFREAVRIARLNHKLEAHAELTTTLTGKLDQGEIRIEVLFPTPDVAGSGPGGKSTIGKKLTSNSMSAVIRLSRKTTPLVLLPGDAGPECLECWKAEKVDACARILVYPHHGGSPEGRNAEQFAAELCNAVKPKTIIFSIHRTKHRMPIPEVVRRAMAELGGVSIACTQLSSHCALNLPFGKHAHLLNLPASGKDRGACCAGSISIDLSTNNPVVSRAAQHATFIDKSVATPLCR